MTQAIKQPTRQGATILTPQQLDQQRMELPAIWKKAAGLLKHLKLDPVAEQQKMRKQWDKREERQIALGHKGL